MLAKLIILMSMALPLFGQAVSGDAAQRAQAARLAESRNDFPTAVREYEALAKLMPHNAEVQSNLGVALYFNHDMTGAAAASQRAIVLNPNLFAPHLFFGLAQYHLLGPDRAVPELEKAVRLKGSDVLAHQWLGYAYVAQLRYDAAVKQFRSVCGLDPKNVDAWYALGQSYLQLGKNATLKLLASAPDSGRVWQLAGEQYQLQGNRQQALEDYLQAIKRRPDVPELSTLIREAGGTVPAVASQTRAEWTKEDAVYRQAHDAEQQAHAAFFEVMRIDPDSYRAHQIMADVFVAKQQPEQAIEEYRAVLKLKPSLPGVHEAIGNVLEQQGKLDAALKEFEAEIQIQPRSSSAHVHAGDVLLTMGRDDEATMMLTAALGMERPPVEVYRLMGKLDLNRKDARSAVSNLTRYVAVRKDDSTAYYLLSKAYRELGEKEKMNAALALFEKTSQDVKARSNAQRQLEAVADSRPTPEDASEMKDATMHN
ncbi:tetratricopeptide repeat protein [Edaphobacter sp.]|uniref:tetratricopeptide repeat protein n=1 Tax=Edaphobacter sp. TaxID=1934404 RepID=UPI002DBE5C2C|nr:tetratricopeptide repeat protein [Edaphobacter sp.]HEU5341000.1 tetratricopeptide repeat protein [Edaphobacter sp.]